MTAKIFVRDVWKVYRAIEGMVSALEGVDLAVGELGDPRTNTELAVFGKNLDRYRSGHSSDDKHLYAARTWHHPGRTRHRVL
jgi:hypothetical protein